MNNINKMLDELEEYDESDDKAGKALSNVKAVLQDISDGILSLSVSERAYAVSLMFCAAIIADHPQEFQARAVFKAMKSGLDVIFEGMMEDAGG